LDAALAIGADDVKVGSLFVVCGVGDALPIG
jgi:NAD(P)H-dependent flavin oxidoreductase YrpB (nitropropane dioxygenase family)